MPHDRFYAPVPLSLSECISLQDEEANHLQKVMRKDVGDTVEIVNGQEQLGTGIIKRSDKGSVLIEIQEIEPLPSLPLKLTLALALTLPSHLEWAIEKGTELGVTTFLLFPGEKSQKTSLSSNQLLRLSKITIAAMKQSGRGDLPNIIQSSPIKEWKPGKIPLFFGDLSTRAFPSPLQKQGEIIFAVGPESGWSKAERNKLISIGGVPLSLHPFTLRAETAAIVAATLFLNLELETHDTATSPDPYENHLYYGTERSRL